MHPNIAAQRIQRAADVVAAGEAALLDLLASFIPGDAHPTGLARFLTACVRLAAHEASVARAVRTAWPRQTPGPATLAMRFRHAGLPPPQRYVWAVRASLVGYAVAHRASMLHIARVLDAEPKTLYRTLANLSRSSGRVPGQMLAVARREQPLWMAWQTLVPLLTAVPAVAWTYPYVKVRGAPSHMETPHGNP